MTRLGVILAAAMHGFGVLCVISGFWTFLWAFIVLGAAVQAWNAPAYHPAVFVVESTSYFSGDVQNPDVMPTAHGKVDGKDESLSVADLLERPPRSEADLAALAPPGREFKVLYNPRAPRAAFQFRYLRVLPYQDDFERDSRKLLFKMAALGYGPLLVFFPSTLLAALCCGAPCRPRPAPALVSS